MSKLSPRDEAILGAAMARLQRPDAAISVAGLISSMASVAALMNSLDPDAMKGEHIRAIVLHLEGSLTGVLGGPAARVALMIANDGAGHVSDC